VLLKRGNVRLLVARVSDDEIDVDHGFGGQAGNRARRG
jgi:hypothetical protein